MKMGFLPSSACRCHYNAGSAGGDVVAATLQGGGAWTATNGWRLRGSILPSTPVSPPRRSDGKTARVHRGFNGNTSWATAGGGWGYGDAWHEIAKAIAVTGMGL